MGLFKKAMFVAGVAATGMAIAPKSGKKFRGEMKENFDTKVKPTIKSLQKKAADLYNKSKEIDSDEVKANVRAKITDVQDTLKELDAKKVGKATLGAMKEAGVKIADISREIAESERTKEFVASAKNTAKKAGAVIMEQVEDFVEASEKEANKTTKPKTAKAKVKRAAAKTVVAVDHAVEKGIELAKSDEAKQVAKTVKKTVKSAAKTTKKAVKTTVSKAKKEANKTTEPKTPLEKAKRVAAEAVVAVDKAEHKVEKAIKDVMPKKTTKKAPAKKTTKK